MSPKFNADAIDDANDYSPIPPGVYEAEVQKVEEKQSDKGTCYWTITLEVIDGQYKGRTFKDKIFFTDKGFKRVKLVLKRLGLKMEGEVNPQKDDILGRRALVNLEIEDREWEGKTYRNNKVPFDGYQPIVEGAPASEVLGGEDLPF